MESVSFLAFDLGATSGRSVLGTVSDEGLTLRELTRFPNPINNVLGRSYWDIFALFGHIKEGLRVCSAENITVRSVGIDTWGVDFVFVGDDGQILGQPRSYRDPHTSGAPQEYFDSVFPRREVYRRTGIQVMDFNSLYQIYAMKRDGSSLLKAAHRALFMPDALSYMLTGNMVTEYTIASTSQLLDPYKKRMDGGLLDGMDVRGDIFPEVVMPGCEVGIIKDDICRETGFAPVPVIAVAGHDTASAVAAVPALDQRFAYLSSGTWSLMGIEVREPVINDGTFALNFTNEGGVEGTTRLLKNITGMWIAEQCLREWKAQGISYSYPEMVAMAQEAEPFAAFIDPDDASFLAPESMLGAITAFCAATGQRTPATHGGVIRMIFESLALKYRYVFGKLRELAPFPLDTLHIIGGGSRNALLNSFTANSLGVRVVAGPSEATAIGNIMIQARSAGMVGSLSGMRKLIARTVETETFIPEHTEAWDAAYVTFKTVTRLNN